MNTPIITLIKIYGPPVLSLVLFFLMFSLKKEHDSGRIKINPTILGFSFFEYELPVSKIWVARIILLCLSTGVLSSLIFMDYSKFFPDHLQMVVFFDQEGIRDSLNVFSEGELEKLGIPDDYEKFQNKYYDGVNVVLGKIFQENIGLSFHTENIHSQGNTSFTIEKLPGILKYHIKESEGNLTNVIERENMPMFQFKSFFEKLNTKHDYLTPSLTEIFIKHKIILQPRFKQIFAENLKSEGKSFHHILVGLTPVYLFPFPKLSNSIYLMQLDDIGLIPIAYAIYR